MTVPVQILSEEQRIWYGKLVVSAILADGNIDAAEIQFLKQVMETLKSPASKKEILGYIETKVAPPLVKPATAIPDQILAAIYLELILVCISDSDFDQTERDFLVQAAEMMEFTSDYRNKMNYWLEEGLEWKLQQQEMLPAGSGISAGMVPVDKFTSEQKYWYASLMVATILLDKTLDQFELSFLKLAISIVESREDKLRLMAHVKNKITPLVGPPPDFSEEVLLTIIFSVVQIVSSDETVSYKEQTYLNRLFELCDVNPALHQRILAWCHKGVSWKMNKNTLAARVRRTNA